MSASPEYITHFSFDIAFGIDVPATGQASSPHPDSHPFDTSDSFDPFVSGSICLPSPAVEAGNDLNSNQSAPAADTTHKEPVARVLLYQEPHQYPREYFFAVQNGHFSLSGSLEFVRDTKYMVDDFEIFDPWMGRFTSFPILTKWESPSEKCPFLVLKSARVSEEDCPGLFQLTQELDDAVEAYLTHRFYIDSP
ncbi:hypothetical protein NP233_g3356 [Leucocoprinus birnbaumii]|uniref:Uncharacterized protein n=1 Tax=Leucocoprinus birnbaumii TaxID=56174 RepID=A0AAD5VX69_9AGAR|nr:hypothetical protein NP233_g3356 [Leucocoprinus birnbaumii]